MNVNNTFQSFSSSIYKQSKQIRDHSVFSAAIKYQLSCSNFNEIIQIFCISSIAQPNHVTFDICTTIQAMTSQSRLYSCMYKIHASSSRHKSRPLLDWQSVPLILPQTAASHQMELLFCAHFYYACTATNSKQKG